MKRGLSSWMSAAADVLLPRVCVVCGERLLQAERHICLKCMADMPLTRFWTMGHNPMADKLNAAIQRELEARDDIDGRERYALAAALFIYKEDSGYRNIPRQLKYHGNIGLGRYFGRMLGRKLASSELFQDVDLVIPVPLHWMRQWRRGYNQAEVIAKEVAGELGAAIDCRILSRRRRTRTQTRLGVEEKAANVSGAFMVQAAHHEARIEGNAGYASVGHILLIDDVFTTGSTLHACFMALRPVFPPSVRISVATLAFVGGI